MKFDIWKLGVDGILLLFIAMILGIIGTSVGFLVNPLAPISLEMFVSLVIALVGKEWARQNLQK